MMVCAGESGGGGHSPPTGEAHAESNRIAERAMATVISWLVDRTGVTINLISHLKLTVNADAVLDHR
jgi:hypothetical protein